MHKSSNSSELPNQGIKGKIYNELTELASIIKENN